MIVEARAMPERGYWAAGKFWPHSGEVHEVTTEEFVRDIKDEPRLAVVLVAPDRQSFDDAKQLIAELREKCDKAVQDIVSGAAEGKAKKPDAKQK